MLPGPRCLRLRRRPGQSPRIAPGSANPYWCQGEPNISSVGSSAPRSFGTGAYIQKDLACGKCPITHFVHDAAGASNAGSLRHLPAEGADNCLRATSLDSTAMQPTRRGSNKAICLGSQVPTKYCPRTGKTLFSRQHRGGDETMFEPLLVR